MSAPRITSAFRLLKLITRNVYMHQGHQKQRFTLRKVEVMHLHCLCEGQSSKRLTGWFLLVTSRQINRAAPVKASSSRCHVFSPRADAARHLEQLLLWLCFESSTGNQPRQSTADFLLSPEKKERLLRFAPVPRGSCVSLSSLAWMCKQFHTHRGVGALL